MKTLKILFTGGGTAGHVTPNIALIKQCQKAEFAVVYLGSHSGVEKDLITKINIPYYGITTGKLRREITWRNLIDPFKTVWGIIQAFFLVRKIKPKIVFSKGGFVSFPVVVGAWLNRIPVIIHESDFSPGLANRLSFPFATKICVTFAATKNYFKQQDKIIVAGTPVRDGFLKGNAEKIRRLYNFTENKRVILIIGGGQGSQFINNIIFQALPELLKQFYVLHVCGPGKINPNIQYPGYQQFEYVHDELFDLMACAEMVISRSGANSLYELLVLKKPHILIPLSTKASRGDQIDNANYSKKLGLSLVIYEEELSSDKLLQTLQELDNAWHVYHQRLVEYACEDGTEKLFGLITK